MSDAEFTRQVERENELDERKKKYKKFDFASYVDRDGDNP